MNQTDRAALVAQALAELNINVPVYRIEADPNIMTVHFYLYGGKEVIWYAAMPDPVEPPPCPTGGTEGGPLPPPCPTGGTEGGPLPDGLTTAAGVGTKTAQALNRLEIINLRQLAAHYLDDEIVELMTPANYRKLGTWLDQHGFFA